MKRAFEETAAEQVTPPKSKKNRYIIIGIVLLLAVLAGGGYYTFVLRQDLDAIPVDSAATAVDGFENADPKDLEEADGWSSIDDYAHWNNAIFTIPEYDNIPLRYRRVLQKSLWGIATWNLPVINPSINLPA
ncbi:hypothetical protein KUH03_14400 [Sphingobacterium sp. E70]|uniref:hypothetical protein n=1 Tax=Sphingobacterium sp. E70 TaxID=2853439 RepID=UPI00211CC2B8|nr:hypothetical protein [Sphingobacterium sp. E70]ULT27744.1 hypothetical protein KUH03_14400 [Sphingobacterium sp. E70]